MQLVRTCLALVACVSILTFSSGCARVPGAEQSGGAYQFAIIGDAPYSEEQERQFLSVIDELNATSLAFVVHVGDTKGGENSPCSEEQLQHAHDLIQRIEHPVIYTPGDNEWTDCHRESNGGSDPLEWLQKIRAIYFQDDSSLGQKPMPLQRQSENPEFKEYPENARWTLGPVMYVTLHVVGSANNSGRTPQCDRESEARNRANEVWLREAFDVAYKQGLRAVVVVMHADPWFEREPDDPRRAPYNSLLTELEIETLFFDGPVLLVHGDTHQFRVDKPMLSQTSGEVIENLTRVESFGAPHVHWLRVIVDEDNPSLFAVSPQIVESNLFDHLAD